MAISTTTLNGTDSVAASRISINDNFNTIKSALNDLLTIIDIATGKINNYGYGSNNDIETEDLIVRGSVGGGISVLSGGINVTSGAIVISNSYLQVGSGSNAVRMEKSSKTLNSGTVPVVDFSGTSGATGGTGPIGYMTIPRMITADINNLISPAVGSIVFDTVLNVFKGCTGSSSAAGGSNWTTF